MVVCHAIERNSDLESGEPQQTILELEESRKNDNGKTNTQPTLQPFLNVLYTPLSLLCELVSCLVD